MSNEETKNLTPGQKKKFTLKIFCLLVILATLGYVGYQLDQSEQKIQQTRTVLSEVKSTTQSQQKTLQAVLDEVNQLKQNMAITSQNQQQLKEALHAEEVRYLVKLAEFNLQFQHNIPQTIDLLKLADQEIHDASFADMRKALAEDIADLQAVPVVDVTGIYMRLLALNGKVDQLPLMNKPSSMTDQAQTTVNTSDSSWWQKGLHQTWKTLRQLVVVRYNEAGKIPLMTPEQQNYLYQNWHAMLTHAMSALLLGQVDIYRASLQQMEQWIKEYCVASSPVTNAFLTELTQLQTININPTIPKLLRSSTAADALQKD